MFTCGVELCDKKFSIVVLAMAASFRDEYFLIPFVTRTYTTMCVFTTIAVVSLYNIVCVTCTFIIFSCLQQLDIITPFQLYFNPALIFKHYQLWRLVTNFLFFGPIGFNFLFNMIFMYPIVSMYGVIT